MTKIQIQTPIRNSLINNNQQNRFVSKSQEPYIRLYKKRMNNNITNLKLNIKQNNYPLNINRKRDILKKIGESLGAFAFFVYLCPRRAK